jgi:hypothetical protein
VVPRVGTNIPLFGDSPMGKIIAWGKDAPARWRGCARPSQPRAHRGQGNFGFLAAALDDPNSNRGRDTGLWSGCMLAGRTFRARPTVPPMADINWSNRAARRQPVPVGGLRHGERGENPQHRPGDGPRRLSRHRFHLDAWGGGAIQEEDPGADSTDGGGKTPIRRCSSCRLASDSSLETASSDFMALAFRTLARNGIRASASRTDERCRIEHGPRTHGEAGGGDFVMSRWFLTLSPIHDDFPTTSSGRASLRPAVRLRSIIRGLAQPGAQTIPITAAPGAKPLELHSLHHRLAGTHFMDAPNLGVSARRLPALPPDGPEPIPRAWS